jgi:hypothetical protein
MASKKENSGHSYQPSLITSGIVFILLLGVVGGVVYYFQDQLTTEVKDITFKSQRTQSKLQEEISTLKEELVRTGAEKEVMIASSLRRLELISLSGCDSYGSLWSPFVNLELAWSFCYKSEWGEPKIEEVGVGLKCKTGQRWKVKFPTEDTPEIYFSTPDFSTSCEGDEKVFCWDCVDFSISVEDQASKFDFVNNSEEKDIDKIKKEAEFVYLFDSFLVDNDVNTLKIIKQRKDKLKTVEGSVGFYIPKAFPIVEFNIEIKTDNADLISSTETLVKSMKIANLK